MKRYLWLCGFFQVTGVVTDAQGTPKWVLTGTWDAEMECAQVIHVEESNKGKPVFETGPHKLLWKCNKPLYVTT